MDKQYRLVTESGKVLLGGETYSRRELKAGLMI